MSVRSKIEQIVRDAFPNARSLDIRWAQSSFPEARVLRVITPSWKSLPRAERNYRLLKILDKNLTEKERDYVFRVSVLTPAEMKRIEPMLLGFAE